MALDLFLQNTITGFRVIYPEDQEKKKTLTLNEIYRVKVTNPRNIKFHWKFYALLNVVSDNLPHDFKLTTAHGQEIEIKTTDSLLCHIKMQIGHYEEKVTIGGKITYEAKSISFSKMDEAQFQAFYSSAIDVILKYFLVGADRESLEDIIIHEFL